MFDLDPAPIIPGDVLLTRPGTEEKAQVRFLFRHKGRREVRALRDQAAAEGWDDLRLLQCIVEGWEGVTRKGEPVPYSPAELATLLDNFIPAGQEIWDAYTALLSTGRLGN